MPQINLRKNIAGVVLCIVAMICSSLLRIDYYTRINPADAILWAELYLPVAAGFLFAVAVLLGEKYLRFSILPLIMGVFFFIFKTRTFPSLVHAILCCCLYLLIAFLFISTVIGKRKSRRALVASVLIPFLVHLFILDLPEAIRAESFTQWELTLSVLLIMFGLVCFVFSLHGFQIEPGDRSDGRKIRTLSPIFQVSPYIMKNRIGSQNLFEDKIEVTKIEEYIRKKRAEGFAGFGFMHVLVAAYVRVVSQKPAINRFIAGQKIYSRGDDIIMSLTVKKEMSADAPDTVIKMKFRPEHTAEDVYHIINQEVQSVKDSSELDSEFDGVAKLFSLIPGLLIKFAVWFISVLDYFGMMPEKLLEVSPFHGSIFITSMGSLGIPPIYHHLYDFGNIPVFVAFGAKRRKFELQPTGEVALKRYVDFNFVMDERICDGFYYASVLKLIRSYLLHPEQLDTPPEVVYRDID